MNSDIFDWAFLSSNSQVADDIINAAELCNSSKSNDFNLNNFSRKLNSKKTDMLRSSSKITKSYVKEVSTKKSFAREVQEKLKKIKPIQKKIIKSIY